MPLYRFHIENGSGEDLVVHLPDDMTAIKEGLRTAADLVSDLSLAQVGTVLHQVEVSEQAGAPVVKIEIHAVRSR